MLYFQSFHKVGSTISGSIRGGISSRWRILCAIATFAVSIGLPAGAAWAARPAVPAYGEVGHFGGFDAGATYTPSGTTSGLKATGEAELVYPVGMAVDTSDPTVPAKDGYAIFVLDLINPQALSNFEPSALTTLSLEYRIQKIGSEGKILGQQQFTLTSTSAVPGLHAEALAVDGATDRVYVLSADEAAPTANTTGANAAYAIDAWVAGHDAGDTVLEPKGELAGPTELQKGTGATLVGDVGPASLVVDDLGAEASLALAGNEYTSEEGSLTRPVIERIATNGPKTGSFEGTAWGSAQDVEDTEDAAAKFADDPSEKLYTASANLDGSLNVTFGREVSESQRADQEPNMATISGDLSSTTATLPWENVLEDTSADNDDRAATIAFHQEYRPLDFGSLMPSGGSYGAGTLAPSAIELSGEAGSFPSGVYAGVVAQRPRPANGGLDPQSEPSMLFSWPLGGRTLEVTGSGEEVTAVTSSSLAIRLFDPQGESLGMIGNVTAGGACNLQGGSYGEHGAEGSYGSFVALVPGRAGTLFALVQPDLDSKVAPFTVSPGAPLATTIQHSLPNVQGDEVVEFAPGAGHACPQPKGGFSVTDESVADPTASTGSEPVTVPAGATVKLEGEVELQGASPWAYEWQAGNGEQKTNAWLNESKWMWPSSVVEFTYPTAGSYVAKMNLINDSGFLAAERTVNVVKGGNPKACFIAAAEATVGQEVKLNASCSTVPEFDAIKSYEWSFGDGQGKETASPEIEHKYTTEGTRTVKLTVIDALGHEGKAEETITIKATPTTTTTTTTTNPPPAPPATTTTTSTGPAGNTQQVNVGPTEVNPHVATTASTHGTVAVKVACPTNKTSCSGTVTLETLTAGEASAKGKHPSPVVIGHAAFSIGGGQSETVQVHLSRKGIALLRARHSLRVQAIILATDPAGNAKKVTQTITLRPAPQGRPKKKR